MEEKTTTDDLSLTDVLASNYMLARLHIRIWSGKRTDNEVAREFLTSKGATSDAAVFVKNLLAGNDHQLKETKAAYTRVRSFFYRETSPWTSATSGAMKGDRLVATKNSVAFLKEFTKLRREAEEALAAFVEHYDQAVQRAATNLGSLFDPSQYPTKAAVSSLFDARMELNPVPSIGDFNRLNIPAELANGLKEVYERSTKKQMDNALADVQERLLGELERTASQLGKLERGEKTRLYKSMTTNLSRLVDMAREINFTKSSAIDQLATEIEQKLLGHDVEAYKNSTVLAKNAAVAAKELASQVREATWRVSDPADDPVEEPPPEPEEELEDPFLAELMAGVKQDLATDNADLDYKEEPDEAPPETTDDFDMKEVFY